MKSLTQLTKKEQRWKWEEKKQKVFEEIKRELIKKRLLRIFNSEKPIVIETDVSDYTTAEILSQEKQSVEFISHKMNKTEQNYIITEKEILAVIQVVKE